MTSEIKSISDYTGLNFSEIQEIKENNLRKYLLYRKDAWLFGLKKTEEGREFLKVLWRLQQTKADTKAIKTFRKKGEL